MRNEYLSEWSVYQSEIMQHIKPEDVKFVNDAFYHEEIDLDELYKILAAVSVHLGEFWIIVEHEDNTLCKVYFDHGKMQEVESEISYPPPSIHNWNCPRC